MRFLVAMTVATLAACASEPRLGMPPEEALPVVHPYDAMRAERGYQLLTETTVSLPAVPRVGIDNLWVVWPEATPGPDYWGTFRKRYGMHEAPFDNDGLPLGIRPVGQYVTFDCLLCHASTVAGKVVLGVANSTLDVQSFLDDLEKAAKLIGATPPVTLRNRTGAAGAVDAVGMAFAFGESYYDVPPGTLNKDCGWERAPAWWQLKNKKRAFNDGTGEAPAFRTMAGTLLAFGQTVEQIAAREAEFTDIGHWILSLEAPRWPFGDLDLDRWERGKTVYAETCAQCHGTNDKTSGSFPDKIVDAVEVGTDPLRTEAFRELEVAALNSTWFGSPPMTDTHGYLAPTLEGIWARAPYLHNGSVPDLMSLLDSKTRPAVWRRTGIGEAEWDKERVGWRYDVPSETPEPDTIEARRIYDTRKPGLSAAGHDYADVLSDDDRRALLEYLKSL
jgi:hypothetical protein